jgi:hypothetical protein
MRRARLPSFAACAGLAVTGLLSGLLALIPLR